MLVVFVLFLFVCCFESFSIHEGLIVINRSLPVTQYPAGRLGQFGIKHLPCWRLLI